jgi:TetR/AcrR family transcriptional repressor of nem operon
VRVSQAEKEKTRERIVASAARLLRERGVEGASVADVMTDAGMTHGGFYRHFETKDDLVEVALDRAFDQHLSSAERRLDDGADVNVIEGFIAHYLSDGHVAHAGQGCPIAALSGEMSRVPDGVRARFAAGVKRMISFVSRNYSGSPAQRRAKAYRQVAMMAGAVAMARSSDPETAAEILAACRGGGR